MGFFVLFLLSNSLCHLIHEWGIRLSIVKFRVFFYKYNNRKIRTFHAETLVNSILCFCNLERYTHTFYVHNQNYFKGEKRGEKITRENGLFYNQRLSLLTEWTILRRICLCVLHCNTRQTKKDIRPLGIFCSTWRLGPCSHDAISGKKSF